MNLRFGHSAALVVAAIAVLHGAPACGQLWRHFVPGAINATTAKHDTPLDGAPRSQFALAQTSGPWLIVAASFSGDGADQQATALAQELTAHEHLTAYVHEMSFKFSDDSNNRDTTGLGAPVRRRLKRGDQVRELAVLVGDFPAIDDPEAQKTLQRIKSLEPAALKVDPTKTTQSMAQARKFEDAVLEKVGQPRHHGPMSQAFLTRNPLLPAEYFVPKGVDPFVAKMNDGVEHSLLDCRGKFTVQVATFRGKSILQTSAKDDAAAKSFWGTRKNANSDPLIEAAENAHMLTEELRAHGWEAYEFHDRSESIVTIGAFAQVGQRQANGSIQAMPDVERVFRTFGAAYDTPADPLTGIGNDPGTQRRVDQEEQQFNMRMQTQQGQIMQGLNPKHVKIIHGHGASRKIDRIIPLDPYPKAIEVPQRSISSAYAGK